MAARSRLEVARSAAAAASDRARATSDFEEDFLVLMLIVSVFLYRRAKRYPPPACVLGTVEKRRQSKRASEGMSVDW